MRHGGGGHVGFGALFKQRGFGAAGQATGIAGGFGHLRGQVAQAGERGFQPRLFADQDHLQLRRRAQLIAVGQGADLIGKGVVRARHDLPELAAQPVMGPKADHREQAKGDALARPARQRLVGRHCQRAGSQGQAHHLAQLGQTAPGRDRRLAFTQPRIEYFGAAHLLAGRLDPHRLVADQAAVFEYWRDISADPVEVAVLAAVLDDPHPALAGLEVLPHLLEHHGGHVGMTDQVVRATDQFGLAETTHGGKFSVAIGDVAGDIGGRNEPLVISERLFDRGDRQVETHVKTPFEAICRGLHSAIRATKPG
ncbi:hypothetical protein D9M71_371130 [compost metagenome]